MTSEKYIMGTNLLESMDERPVDEVPQKELVTTSDRCRQVTKGQCGGMLLSIPPVVGTGDNDTNHVESKCDAEVLSSLRVSLYSKVGMERLTIR